MAKVENLNTVMKVLGTLGRAAGKPVSVTVGFTQRYAIKVHEVNARHSPGKQWKFLEQPSRQFAKDVAMIVKQIARQTGDIGKGLLAGGYRLLREAQEIVPIDTGALRASGFVGYSQNEDQLAVAAFQKSEAIRLAALAKRGKKPVKTKKVGP